MTGDVFRGITIPGTTPIGEGLGIVLTHPATERGAERHTSVEAFHGWVRSSDASGTSRSAHGLLRSLTDKPDVLSDSRLSLEQLLGCQRSAEIAEESLRDWL